MTLNIVDGNIVVTPTEIDLQDENLVSLNLKVLFDCCTTLLDEQQELPIEGDTITIPYSINPDGSVLKDGVYQVELYAEYQNQGKTKETLCIFADTTLKCQIAEYVATSTDTDLGWLYVLLLKTNECECNCTSACEIVKKVRAILAKGPVSCKTC